MSVEKEVRPCRGCWTFYDEQTGIFRGTFAGSIRGLAPNTRSGMKAIEGRFNPRTQRVDLDTGKVVPYQAPPNAKIERGRVHARIIALEAKQHRRVRELLAESDPQLQAIEMEIAKLRGDL